LKQLSEVQLMERTERVVLTNPDMICAESKVSGEEKAGKGTAEPLGTGSTFPWLRRCTDHSI